MTDFSQWFCYDLLLLTVLFNIGCFSFYSVILGSWGITDSPPWLPRYQSPCCSNLSDEWFLSLFLIVSLFWCFFPKSLLLTFHFRVSLESWPSISLPPMLSRLYLFRLSFLAAFSFCHFSQVSWILPCQVEGFPSYFPLWFFFLGYPKYQPFACELLLFKPFGSLLRHCVFEKDISVLRFLCFLVPFLSCLNPTLAALYAPGISRPVLFTGLSLVLWSWLAGPFSFFPLFHGLLKPTPSWILGFKSFRPTILFFCELNPFFLILLSMGLA